MMISVILPAYNAEKTIEETLLSVDRQTLHEFELVVINDGSTDSTGELIRRFVFRDGIKVCVVERENMGFLASLVEGVEVSTGEFIARIDSDDVWLSEHLEKCLAHLCSHPQCVLVGTNACYVDGAGNVLSVSSLPCSDSTIRKELLRDNQFVHSSVMFRREAYNKTGGYLCATGIAAMHIADYNLWLELSLHGEIANLSDVTLKYRVASTSMSRTVNLIVNYKARMAMMRKAYSFYGRHHLYYFMQLFKVYVRIMQCRLFRL